MKIKIIYMTDVINVKTVVCEYFNQMNDGWEFLGENRRFMLYVKNVIYLERMDEKQS